MKNLLKASNVRFLSMLLAVIFALPLSWKGLTGIYAWLSPFIMLNSVFVLKSMVWLNSLGFIVLFLSFYRKRWFCRYLCPVGWGCDSVSRFSRREKFSPPRIPDLGRWLAMISLVAALTGIPLFVMLDPMSIFNGFFSTFSGSFSVTMLISLSGLPLLLVIHLFFPGIWCNSICPLGGLQDEVSSIKNVVGRLIPKNKIARFSENNITGRRYFIASGIGVISGIVISKLINSGHRAYFRPPGSVPANSFNTLCIRCGNCIKVCPTSIIIHHTGANTLLALMTPEVTFEDHGYCLEDCNLCSKVCPSGAITLFSIKAKDQLKIGTAVIHPENCLLTRFTECDRCYAACSYKAIEIVPYTSSIQMIPVTDTDKCVGCGACAAICPTLTIEMIPFI